MKNLPRINTFSHHYRGIYGQGVGKIPIDLGFPCPNRRKGGCIFCQPASFSPASLQPGAPVAEQIARGKKLLLKSRFRLYFAYFQQETATAPPTDLLMPVFTAVLADPDCVGLILSTRPDCLRPSLLEQLANLVTASAKACHIELGLQSCHEKSLQRLNRNHSYADFTDAAQRISPGGVLTIGVHLLFGIPGETEDDMLATIAMVTALNIQAIKFHHLQVIKGTTLHSQYLAGEIAVFSEDQYQDFLLRAIPLIPPSIAIHRIWATAHPDLLIAPRWQTLASELSRKLLTRMELLNIYQGQEWIKLHNQQDGEHLCRAQASVEGKTCQSE